MIEKETTKEIVEWFLTNRVNTIQKEILSKQNKEWVSVESLLKLSPDELIDEVRKLHIQKEKEIEEE
jgi:hypothetical protein